MRPVAPLAAMARLRTHRRAVAAGVVALLVVVALAIGLAEGGGETTTPDDVPTLAEARAAVAGAPPALARLWSTPGGTAASGGVPVLDLDRAGFRRLLRGLRGRPVLVNVWYPGCPPCRREFPILRTAAAEYGDRMAFVGVATQDLGDLDAYLEANPTLYPHVRDPKALIARTELSAGLTYPSSVLIDPRGTIVAVKGSEYTSLQALRDDLAGRLDVRPGPAAATGATTRPSSPSAARPSAVPTTGATR